MQSGIRYAVAVALFGCTVGAIAQMPPLRSSSGKDARRAAQSDGAPAAYETEAILTAKLAQADAKHRGEVWLEISADAEDTMSTPRGPAHVTLRIPLSSTEDVYGESRSCKVKPDGTVDPVYSAGMDERNFLRFAAAEKEQDIHLLLNKYLCRALAAPFHCGGREVALPQDWSKWRLAKSFALTMKSAAPATLLASLVTIRQSDKAFDSAQCAVVAPSNGLCCVANKTTEWHCGGTPAGEGWHQVSGECFHRETGGTCTDKTVFPPLQ